MKRYPAVSDLDTMWLIAILSPIPEFTDYLLKSATVFCDYLLEAIFKGDERMEKVEHK